MRLLQLASRQFTTAALSTRATLLSDAARILSLACLAAIADAVVRRAASDVPSLLSLHYSGEAAGPGKPFGFAMGDFRVESERMRFHDPPLLARRTEVPAIPFDSPSIPLPFPFHLPSVPLRLTFLGPSLAFHHQVLDYFEGVAQLMLAHAETSAELAQHTLFGFEASMQFGEAERRLLSQLTWHVGYPSHGFPECEGHASEAAAAQSPQIWRYLTGETRELLDDMPELEALRDVVFLLKAFMAPCREDLPEARPWHVSDAVLSWSSTKDGKLSVRAFRRSLEGAYASAGRSATSSSTPPADGRNSAGSGGESKRGGVLGGFGPNGWLRSLLGGSARRPRVPLSSASASVLANVDIETEDDVLHLENKELPTFNKRISPSESEYLLSVLCAPYVRVPLLLAFFSAAHRVTTLGEPAVQETLDAALFEPGLWQPDVPKTAPSEVPSTTRACFATPAGLLLNELNAAPEALLGHLLELGRNAIDLDPGRFGQGAPLALLYVMRLMVRVEGHARHLLAPATTRTRGFQPTRRAERALPQLLDILSEQLWSSYFPALERWANKALARRDSATACIVFAHLAFLCKNMGHVADGTAAATTSATAGADSAAAASGAATAAALGAASELSFRQVSTLLVAQVQSRSSRLREIVYDCSWFPLIVYDCLRWLLVAFDGFWLPPMASDCFRLLLVAQCFLTNFFAWDVDAPAPSASEPDEKPSNGASSSAFADSAILIPQTELLQIFQTHRHAIITWLDAHPAKADEVFEAVERTLSFTGTRRRKPSDKPARPWMRHGSHGRFMPGTERVAAELSRVRTNAEMHQDGYERWYWRVCNESVATMINVELGEFSVRANKTQLVSEAFGAFADYEYHFGQMDAALRPQCAVIQATTHRCAPN